MSEDRDDARPYRFPDGVRRACYAAAAIAMVVAVAVLVVIPDKTLGIFGLLLAVIASRVLVLNIAEDRS